MSEDRADNGTSSELPAPVQIVKSFRRFLDKVVLGSYPLFFATMAVLVIAIFYTETVVLQNLFGR